MSTMTILMWLKDHKNVLTKAILSFSVALSFCYGIITHKQNLKLSERLEIAQNNIEAYLDALNGSLLASNVLLLDVSKLKEQNDYLLLKIDSVAKENNIKSKNIKTAATQKQTLLVTGSRGVGGDIITILKDTTYQDSLKYNDLTKVYYKISKDSVWVKLDVQNTQYLYVYTHKEYKNKKSFLGRLFTFDWKKVTKHKYKIINENPLLKTDSVRVIESNKL